MIKQLALSLCAGLLLSLPACGCKDNCSNKAESTETSVDAQATTCADAACTEATCVDASACTSCETAAVKE